jgi:hypothetical protein
VKKQILLIAVIIAFCLNAKAQTKEEIINNFKTLLLEAATDFKNVKGKILEDDVGNKTAYYNCNKTLGSSFEAICINSGDNTTYYSSKFEYSKTPELIKATEILPGILDEANAMIKSGKYLGRDYKKSETIEITEVKDLEGNYILEIESTTNAPDGKDYLMVTIFGKSWGKK